MKSAKSLQRDDVTVNSFCKLVYYFNLFPIHVTCNCANVLIHMYIQETRSVMSDNDQVIISL